MTASPGHQQNHANHQPVFRNRHLDVWREHAPPHFHVMYGEHEAQIDIWALEVIIERSIEYRAELTEDWNLCQAKQQPKKIQPLE